MSNFQEPVILAKLDRSFGDRHEELRLEQGEFKGQPTYTLRVCWQGNDQKWRWATQKPSENSGKCFKQLQLKSGELEKLGQALIAAAKKQKSAPGAYQDDDIPF